MFDAKEIAERALLRADMIHNERASKKKKTYYAIISAVSLCVIVGLSFVIPSTLVAPEAITATSDAVSAALLAGRAYGRYVLIGVIGFILGAAVTAAIARKLKKE